MSYRPSQPFNVPLWLFTPIITRSKGVNAKNYSNTGELIYCSFRSFGGTEKVDNGILIVENTAIIETWYRPDICSDCMIKDENGLMYEVLGTPENINMRNQILKFKIRAVKGGA